MADRRRLPLVGDTRGVSEVVGFILVFGFLILALTLYQATVVPQQNAQTEFQHFEDVRNEMIELRNAVSTAGQADVSQFPSVTLGTNYRTRLLTINPPDPAGTLRTSDSYNITISNGNEEDDLNISTRFVEYRPGYNEISIGSTWLEHSVLYLDERDRGGVSIIQEQNIVKNGTVTITALQNQFQETDTGRVTLELYPQENVNRSAFPNGNLTVKVPTRLSESDWNSTLNYSGEIYNGVDPDSRLNLSVNSTDLNVNTVGIREEPNEGAAKNVDPYAGDDSGDSGSSGGGGGGGGGSSSDPSFATIVISDNSGGTGNSNKASYSISYTVSDPDSNLNNVTWEFTNTNRGETLLQGEGGVTGSDSGESGGGRFGDTYQITVKLFSQSGEITSERVEITDTANADGIIYQDP